MAYTNAIFYQDYVNGSDTARTALTSCVASNPSGSITRIAKTAHGLVTGAIVDLSVYTTWLNAAWKITVVDADNFDLDTAVWQATADADGTVTPRGGMSWTDAWKTMTLGATAARLLAGDTIRIAKSPDPTSLGQTATWTNLSKTVTLSSAVTLNMSLCESGWTAGTNVTLTYDTAIWKEGTKSVKLASGGAFTTGELAYIDLGAQTDFSAYQQISLWFRNETTALATAGDIRIRFFSDATRLVQTGSDLYIPAVPSIAMFLPVTIDNGGALPSDIRCISIIANITETSKTFYIDNILACKDATAADSLTLTSLISKNSAALGGTECWCAIQSINGTTILLDAEPNCYANAGQGYYGTTEAVTTYKRETIKTTLVPSASTVIQASNKAGTLASQILYEGGYNTSDSTVDGETFFDGLNGWGCGFYFNNSYNKLKGCSFVRYQTGVGCNNTILGYLDIYQLTNNTTNGFDSNAGSYLSIFTVVHCNSNKVRGVSAAITHESVFNITNCNNNRNSSNITGGGFWIGTGSFNNTINLDHAHNNGYGGIGGGNITNTFYNLVTSNNTQSGVQINQGGINLVNCSIGEATEVGGFYIGSVCEAYSSRHDQTANNSWIFSYGGTINYQTSINDSPAAGSWNFKPIHLARATNYPLHLKVAQVICAANAEVTITARMRRDHTNLTMSLVCPGGQIQGVATQVKTDMTASANTWETVTITFTPTEKGAVIIYAHCSVVTDTNRNGYVCNVVASQA